MRSSTLEDFIPLACGVMGFASSSIKILCQEISKTVEYFDTNKI